jgi:hypothetical protein
MVWRGLRVRFRRLMHKSGADVRALCIKICTVVDLDVCVTWFLRDRISGTAHVQCIHCCTYRESPSDSNYMVPLRVICFVNFSSTRLSVL